MNNNESTSWFIFAKTFLIYAKNDWNARKPVGQNCSNCRSSFGPIFWNPLKFRRDVIEATSAITSEDYFRLQFAETIKSKFSSAKQNWQNDELNFVICQLEKMKYWLIL